MYMYQYVILWADETEEHGDKQAGEADWGTEPDAASDTGGERRAQEKKWLTPVWGRFGEQMLKIWRESTGFLDLKKCEVFQKTMNVFPRRQ